MPAQDVQVAEALVDVLQLEHRVGRSTIMSVPAAASSGSAACWRAISRSTSRASGTVTTMNMTAPEGQRRAVEGLGLDLATRPHDLD